MVVEINNPKLFLPDSLQQKYPSHLHIDIMKRAQVCYEREREREKERELEREGERDGEREGERERELHCIYMLSVVTIQYREEGMVLV